MRKVLKDNFCIHKMRRRDFTVVPVKRRQPDLFESIFLKGQGFNEVNVKILEEDLCVAPTTPNANILNQSCLLLNLWSRPFKNNRESRLSYSAGPNMEQKNTFQVMQYMTRTWKKNTTALPLPKKFTRKKERVDSYNFKGENNFRLLTPELLGFTAGENWKNKKATLVVKLSPKSLIKIQKQTFQSKGTVTFEDNKPVFRLTLPTDKSLQTILNNSRYPKAWIRNIYDEKKDDIQNSKDFVKKIYIELQNPDVYDYIATYLKKGYDDTSVALSLEAIVNNKSYLLNKTELKVYFNFKQYLINYNDVVEISTDQISELEFDDKESFFKIIFETVSEGMKVYILPLEAENRRFNIGNNFKIGLKVQINLFHFIYYAYNAENEFKYVYIQQVQDDLPYIELSELTWSNKANIFNNSNELDITKEIILKPIFPKQADELEIETFLLSGNSSKANEIYKKIVEKSINECINSKNVYPLDRKINLKYGCLVPHTLSKDIFKNTGKLLKEHILRILEAKQSFSFKAYLNQSLWLERTKRQLIKYLIRDRQITLIKRLPGFTIWEKIMAQDQKLYEWEVVMFRNQLYKLNRNSKNFIWAKMKTNYIIDLKEDTQDYFKGEILKNDTDNKLYEFIKNNYGLDDDEFFDIQKSDTFLTYDDVMDSIEFRPNGYGIKNLSRFYRDVDYDPSEQVYHINPSETPLNNVFLKLQGKDKDNAKDYITTDELTNWEKLQDVKLDKEILISGYENKNENFVNCYDDVNFVENVKKIWNINSYMPSIYLQEHFEFLKGFLKPTDGFSYEKEFFLDPLKIVEIEYTKYEKNFTRQPSKDPNTNLFKITIVTNKDQDDETKQIVEAPWWEAWYTEWVFKRNLFKDIYTDLEVEYLNKNYKKIFIDFVNTFTMHYNTPPVNFITTVLK